MMNAGAVLFIVSLLILACLLTRAGKTVTVSAYQTAEGGGHQAG